MRAYRLGKVATAAALFAAVTVGGARAEDPATAPKGEVTVKTTAVLTLDQQLEQGQATARKANQLAERMTRMLDEARRDKDIMRANCVNRKLTEVNANGRNVEQRLKSLKDAIDAKDEARANHEYTVLSVLGQKIDSLNLEASQCLGQSVYEPGASQVTTTVPSTAPSINPAIVPAPAPPPPSVSIPPVQAAASPAS
jgi:flagellar motility protein MotE (MotC chaperone)